MKRFYIDQDDIRSLHLTGSVLLCYTALRALCANPSNSWQGSYQRLSEESGCGSRMTAERSVTILLESGLIRKEGNRYSIAQNEQSYAQNEQSHAQNEQSHAQNEQSHAQNEQSYAQNVQNSKESTKENIIIENNCSSLSQDIKSKQPPQPVFSDSFSPPEWKDILEYAKEKKIPESLCIQFFSYYTANGWTLKKGAPMQSWKAVLTYWVIKEKNKAAKQVYQSVYGKATTQEQTAYAGSQYAEYEQRKERERQADLARQQNPETQYIPYNEWKKMQEQQK